MARLAYELLLRPLLPKALIVAGVLGVALLSSLDDFLFEPVPGLFGLGTPRSLDSWKRGSAIALR